MRNVQLDDSRFMCTRTVLAAAGLLAACSANAFGQVWVSGLEHRPLGSAVLGAPAERRLPVSNLGSSGNDGVEIRCNSAFGCAASVDLDGLLAPSPVAREIRIRPKGWDGTIKGNMRLASRPPDGTPRPSLDLGCNFSQVSATTVRVTVRDMFGNVVLDSVMAGSNLQCVVTLPPPALTIPTCGVAIKTKGTGADANRVIKADFGALGVDVTGLSPVALHEVRSIEFSPATCGACDSWPGTESALITSVGLPSIAVSDASLSTFGVSSYAVGATHVDESCDNVADCNNVRRLRASNLGSSGQDGVAIDLANANLGADMSLARGNCCRGHITLIKLYDDLGHEAGRVSNSSDTGQTSHTLTFDGTASGVQGFTLVLRNAGGATLSSIDFNGPVVDMSYIGPCDASLRRNFGVNPSNLHMDLCNSPVTVFVQGTVVAGVSSVSMDCRTGMQWVPASLSRMELTGNPTSYMEISNFSPFQPPPLCLADFNGDGAVDFFDYLDFVDAFSLGVPEADFNWDGAIDFFDYLDFVDAFSIGC